MSFQFGHGGEPWSHGEGRPFSRDGIGRFNSATAVSRGVTAHADRVLCVVGLFQFGHGGEPWSHLLVEVLVVTPLLVSIRPRR